MAGPASGAASAPAAVSADQAKSRRELARLDGTSVVYKSKKGRVQALDSVSLTLHANEVVALVGPSGCGKSTTLRMIAGLLAPTAGTVDVAVKRHTRALGGLSMMFQTPTLLDWRTVLGNVMLPLETRDISKAEACERSAHMLERVGVADFMHRRPYELSGGMQQRVAVARALVSEPEMLLLDEPFGALDAITRDQMCVELEGLVEERSMSVLLITHSIAEAILLGDRIVVMSGRPGSILEEIEVPLAKPRSITDRISPAANEIESRLLRLLAVRLSQAYPRKERPVTETVSALSGAPVAASGPRGPATGVEGDADRRARYRAAVLQFAQRTGIVAGVLAAIVGIWAAVCAIWKMPPAELPTPLATWHALTGNWGTIWGDTEPTVVEAVAGYAISIAFGVPLGFLLSRPGWLSTALNAGTVSMQIFPKICLAPLFLVWFGFGYFPKILFVVLLGFFPIAINAAAGFSSVPSDVRELGSIIGFGPLARLRRLNGPWALPQIFTGLKVSASFIVIAAIVIEFTGAETGLGVLIIQSQTSLNLSLTFATVIIVAVVGFLIYGLVSLAEVVAIPWHVSRRHK